MSERVNFDDAFRARLHDLFVWRRDVRRFRAEPLPPGALDRLIGVACLSPSVGLSQPWRFVTVDDPLRRRAR
jgi:5,6-dimethylbenzimidazole synthase